jgi:hypothetical protein
LSLNVVDDEKIVIFRYPQKKAKNGRFWGFPKRRQKSSFFGVFWFFVSFVDFVAIESD